MKTLASIFAIVFCGFSISWFCLLVVGADDLNTTNLKTSLTVSGDEVVIPPDEGLAARGKQVYREFGCVACHTQQVRRPGYGGDLVRDWGSRQTVPRDYVLQDQVMIGGKRMGPDLSNVGARHDAAWFYTHLNNPGSKSAATTMPSYSFLFRQKEINGTSAVNALDLQANETPPEGYEVVPTDKAVALVAYLQSLKFDYDLPESKRIK